MQKTYLFFYRTYIFLISSSMHFITHLPLPLLVFPLLNTSCYFLLMFDVISTCNTCPIHAHITWYYFCEKYLKKENRWYTSWIPDEANHCNPQALHKWEKRFIIQHYRCYNRRFLQIKIHVILWRICLRIWREESRCFYIHIFIS